MIWITTLCLLALGGWFFFNALNERRWVEAHSHDESVAGDEGLFAGFTAITGSGKPETNGKVSISQENTRFAKAVAKVQEKTGNMGDSFLESKAAAAAAAKDEDTFFGRAVARVSEKTESYGKRLDDKMKSASGALSSSGSDENLVARTSRKVAERSNEISNMVAERAKNMSEGYRSASKDHGMFGKMVKSVSGGIEKMESKVDSRISKAKSDDGEDLVTRVASKVGNKINELGNKTSQRHGGDSNTADKVD